mgnify:FL=1
MCSSDLGALADLVTLDNEQITAGRKYTFYHPFAEADFFEMQSDKYARCEPLLKMVMQEGRRLVEKPSLQQIQAYAQKSLETFHKSYLRQINPHIYKVSLSSKLKKLKMDLLVAQRRKTKEEQ